MLCGEGLLVKPGIDWPDVILAASLVMRLLMMVTVGGKDKTRIRNATPPDFKSVLLGIARLADANQKTNPELAA